MTGVALRALVSQSASHRGPVRAVNEDAVLDMPGAGLWAVADGMGGHAHGGAASRAVVAALETAGGHGGGAALLESLPGVLRRVNAGLVDFAARVAADIVGSTVAVLVLEGERYHCLWAGDSRVYLYRDGGLTQLTTDHRELGSGARSGALTRAVGGAPDLELDYVRGTLYQDDVFLLCSDGIHATLPAERLAAGLGHSGQGAAGLVETALAAGARDNVSCVTVFVHGGSGGW